jgi:hypothetical protein
MSTTEYHALERTSPEGGPFVGYCIRCGMTGLPMSAVTEECKNTREMTAAEAVLDSVALKRIIEEVRDANELGGCALSGYNRVYHRHNR